MNDKWGENARLRKEQIESGKDLTFSKIFVPYYKDIIERHCPITLLEIGSGTGHIATELSNHISKITCIEPSSGMFEILKQTVQDFQNITPVNSKLEEFESNEKFDFVISHLCIHTVKEIETFCTQLSTLVDVNGQIVLSIPHPCFYNDYKQFFGDEEYDYINGCNKDVSFSISKDPDRLINSVPYFHRPMQEYVRIFNNNNLTISSIDEIYPTSEVELEYPEKWKVPRYLVFTLSLKKLDIREIQHNTSQLVKKNKWDLSSSMKPQTPKNLAISISLEASELLECFQWSETAKSESVEEELADIMIYASHLANQLGINLENAVREKLKKNQSRTWKDDENN